MGAYTQHMQYVYYSVLDLFIFDNKGCYVHVLSKILKILMKISLTCGIIRILFSEVVFFFVNKIVLDNKESYE